MAVWVGIEVDVTSEEGVAEEITNVELVASGVTIAGAVLATGVQDTKANVNINAKNNDFKISSSLILVNFGAAQRSAFEAPRRSRLGNKGAVLGGKRIKV